MIVYIIRHGQTVWNAKRIIQGRSNNRLSQLGKEQIEKVSKTFQQGDVDLIYCSPLVRTLQTAKILNETLKCPIIKDERIIEVDKGILTRRKKASLTEEEKRLRIESPETLGVETKEKIIKRAKEFLVFLKQKHQQEKVLIVTHGLVSDTLESLITENENVEHYQNAELRKFEITI